MDIGSAEWKRLIINGAKRLEINIESEKTELFAVYAAELMTWNRKINLTAIRKPQDVAVKHFIDSIIPSLLIAPDARMLDIGSGGGFPGIPLKILMPSLSVVLIDASRKKISFLKHVIRILKLENIEAWHGRVEDFVEKEGVAQRFDVIISRALTSLKKFVLMASPLLAEDGKIMAMKGSQPLEEFSSNSTKIDDDSVLIEIGKIVYFLKIKKYMIPYDQTERSILILTPQ